MIEPTDIEPADILNPLFRDNLFVYSDEEVECFNNALTPESITDTLDCISSAMDVDVTHIQKVNSLIQFIKTLSAEDVKAFENLQESYLTKYDKEPLDSNPNMLWDMLQSADRALYKKPTKFYNWLNTLTDEVLDGYIYRAADGLRLHPDYLYPENTQGSNTTVEILDGFIAISSSNKKALDKFRDRILASNSFEYEHRVKQHGEVTIHSYTRE